MTKNTNPGLCGLENLGKTSCMNSVIQCLSSIPLLTEHFVSEKYLTEIKEDNILQQKSELARAYAGLIKEMWNGKNSFISPTNFKAQLKILMPQFNDTEDLDPKELLSFILCKLNEDLNRVYTVENIDTGKDDNDKTIESWANEIWENLLKKYDSIVVDTFYCLVKSTFNCLECGKISINFDTKCFLSLPLLSKKERLIEITYVPLDQDVPFTKYKLNVSKNGKISDLCDALEQYVNIPKYRFAVCDIYNFKIFHLFELHEPVGNIREKDDIFIFQCSANFKSSDHFKFYLYLRHKSQYAYNTTYFGLPSVLLVPKNELSLDKLYEKAAVCIRRLIGDKKEVNLPVNANHTTNQSISSFFSLSLSKADQYSYEDSSQLTENLVSQITSLSQHYLLIADSTPQLKEYSKDIRILKDVVQHESCNTKLVNKPDALTLDDCYNLFTKKEELRSSELWYCLKCKKEQQATKQMDLWSLPPVLIMHLQRFSYPRVNNDKIDTLVDFPVKNLDLTSFIKNTSDSYKNKYNLIAVANHHDGLGNGHYSAYTQNCHDGNWYNFNDTSVLLINDKNIVTPAAYLLVY